MKQHYSPHKIGIYLALLAFMLTPRISSAQEQLRLSHQGSLFFAGCTLHLGQTRVGNPVDALIRLENLGTTPLTGITATVGGNFSLTNSPPASLNPTASFDLSVRFSALTAGTFYSTLTVNSSDPNTPSYTLTLAATARAASLDGLKLVINEFSNGGFGQQEYIELVAVGEPATCVDLRGYRIDDNSGRGKTCNVNSGISPGYLEFSDHAQWARFPVGGLILIFNPEDVNLNIGVIDPYDSDGDLVYSIPVNDANLFRLYTSSPAPGFANCNLYNGQGSTRSWSVIGLDDSGDLIQVVRPDGQLDHSVAYILQDTEADIEFPFTITGEDRVFFLINNVDTDPKLPANWSENTTMGFETPGSPNSLENQEWIESLRARIFVCSSAPCAGEAATLHSNARVGIDAWNWDFDNDGSGDASEIQAITSFSFPYIGQFRSILIAESQSGSCQVRGQQIFNTTNCERTIVANLQGDFCLDDSNPALVGVPFIANGSFHPGNVFTLYLVGPSASIAIGTLNSTTSGTINGTIPAGTENGSNYRFRIDASNPPTTGFLSPPWTRVVNTDTRVCDIALVSSTFSSTFFDSSPSKCRQETTTLAKVFLKAGLSGEPIGATLNGAVADVEWHFSSTSSNVASMSPFTPAVRGLWYTPYFTTPGTYFVRARAECPCGPDTWSEAIEIRVLSRDSIAYQGGEEEGTYTDCWTYLGFDANSNPASVTRLDPPNAKICEGVLRISNSGASWIEMRDVFLEGVNNPQFSVSYRTDPGNGTGAGLDQQENIQFEYSLDCGVTWIPAGLVAGGSDLGFDWTENQAGINNGANPCCLGGNYTASTNGCGHCNAPCPAACLNSVALNPLTLNLPASARNFRVRMRFVNNALNPTAPNRPDEVVYFDNIRLDGTLTSQPQVSLSFSGPSALCRESTAQLTAAVTNFDLTGACGMQYAFEWWVDGTKIATDLTSIPTSTRTLSGLRNRSSVWVRVGLYGGSDPNNLTVNGCLLYCPVSVPIVMDSIPAPEALLTVRDVSSTLVCRPRPSVLRVELEGSAPWNIQYSVNNGPAVAINGILKPTHDFDWFPTADGTYTISLISVSDANCPQGETSGTVNVTVISPPTGVDAGLDQTVCKLNASPLNVNIGTNQPKTGRWETVSSPSNVNLAFAPTQYENRLDNVELGTYALAWIEGLPGCTTSDLVQIHVIQPPAIAGISAIRPFCESEALLLAPHPDPGTGTWLFTSGPTTPVIANLNSTITRVTGLSLPGPYVFTWSVEDAPCPSTSIDITLDANSTNGTDGLWRGFLNGDWTRCANWDNQRVPNSSTNVAIRTAAIFTPLDWNTVPATQVRSLELNTNNLALPVNRLTQPLSLSEKLELRQGQLRTDRLAGRVRVLSDQLNAVEFHSLNSYVSGILERAVTSGVQYDLPVGTDQYYQFAQVTTDGQFSGPSTLTAEFIDRPGQETIPSPNVVNGAPFENTIENGYWKIVPNQLLTQGTYAVRLRKTNSSPVGNVYTVARRGVGDWLLPLHPAYHISWTMGNPPPYVEAVAGGFSSFSDFDIAYSNQPLILNRQEFSARWLNPTLVRLGWYWQAHSPIRKLIIERAYLEADGPASTGSSLQFSKLKDIPLIGRPYLSVDATTDIPSSKEPVIYYRLQFHHDDGTATYSDIRELRRDEIGSASCNATSIRVYPNPTSGDIILSYDITVNQPVDVCLYSPAGQELLRQQHSGVAGFNMLSLDLSNLDSGFYYLHARSTELNERTKIVVLK